MMMQCETILARDNLDEQTRCEVELLQRKVRSLSSMIAQLLQLSRADRGQEQLQYEAFSLTEIAESVAEEYAELALEKNIHLNYEINTDINVAADQTLLIRMLANLLQNAITYGKQNGHIWLHTWADDNVNIEVRDDGIGIDEQHLPHIWDRFYQVDPSRSRSGSSGLGLSMVKWIVEAHKGHITVQSTPNKGTSFLISLPILDRSDCDDSIAQRSKS